MKIIAVDKANKDGDWVLVLVFFGRWAIGLCGSNNP